jgi:pseudouridine synthase
VRPDAAPADDVPCDGALDSGTPRGSWLEIVLTEGKKRQVRRMCARVGHDVLELVRVRIGLLDLGDLAPREWRVLGAEDEAALVSRSRSSARA